MPALVEVADARDQIVRGPAGETLGVLTLGEAAARLGLPRAQLVAMAGAGELATVEVGAFGARFVPAAEVERLGASS